mmetsp:Transcript_17566/g.41700  ORF Transcript_17566/g.41700 Transcript_17566/m.41700 type:complete len:207 (-) Transcript_17566:40-660(-)
MAKSVDMQVLKRGQQMKRTVDLEEDVTVQDILAKLAALTGEKASGLFLAEVRNLEKVRLFSGEAPNGTFEVGGLDTVKDLPDVIHVKHSLPELSQERGLMVLDDLIAAYKDAELQAKLAEIQQGFLSDGRDLKAYGLSTVDTVRAAQEPVVEKWGFKSFQDLFQALTRYDISEEYREKQMECAKLLGQTFEWAPEFRKGLGQMSGK